MTYRRLEDLSTPHGKMLVSLQGIFSKEFVSEFSRIIPQIVAMDFDISNYPDAPSLLMQYSTFVWELKKKFFLGVTALPMEYVKKLIIVTENIDFLKLLLLTPMGSAIKDFLVVKPKGAIAIDDNTLNVFLPTHRADFVYYWLEKLFISKEITVEWLSGLSEEIPDDLQQNTGLLGTVEENLSHWQSLAKKGIIDDFNITFREAIKLLGGRP